MEAMELGKLIAKAIREGLAASTSASANTLISTNIVPFPSSLNVSSGDVRENFKIFRSNWESFCSATGMNKWTEDRNTEKVNALLLMIGDEAKMKYNNFSLTTEEKQRPVDEVLDIIEARLGPELSVLLERTKFFSIQQKEEESYVDFCKRVEKAAERCQFNKLTPQIMIRDRVILGSFDKKLIKKFFEMDESKLDLPKVLQLGQGSEITASFMNEICSSDREKSVNKIKPKEQNHKNCKYCGDRHSAKAGDCKALGATCNFCRRKNHFEKVCFRKQSGRSSETRKSQSRNVRKVEQHKGEIKDNLSEVSYASVEKIIDRSSKGGNVQAELSLKLDGEWTKVYCDLDTGAQVCIIGYNFLREMLRGKKPQLKQSSMSSISVTKNPLQVVGCTKIPIRVKKQKFNVLFHVVSINHGPLLSANACVAMGLVKFCNLVRKEITNKLKSQAELIVEKYANVFEGIGLLPGEASLKVDPEVRPSNKR